MTARAGVSPEEQKNFPLWAVVLAAAMIAGLSSGIRHVMGLYQRPVTEHLGLGREAFSLAIAIANIVWGLAAPVAGAVSDKYGTGRVVVFGSLTTVIGLVTMWMATSDAHLLVSGVFMGLGIAGAGTNAMVGAVGRNAPPNERAAAIARVGMGAGVGVFISLPYTHLLIAWFGWQTSLIVLASTAMVMFALAVPVSGRPMSSTPKDMPSQSLGQALGEAFRHPSFWLLNVGFFVCGFHVVFYGVHLPAYVADQGMAPEIAVFALTLVGVGNLFGTYLSGVWGRYYSKRVGLSLIYSGRAVVFLGFLFLPINGTLVLVASGILGLLWLSTVPLTSSLVATFYGPKWMAMLYGIVFFSHQVGSFLGVWMAGRLYDMTQSYDIMWWISVGLGVFAALIHWPIKERPVSRIERQAHA